LEQNAGKRDTIALFDRRRELLLTAFFLPGLAGKPSLRKQVLVSSVFLVWDVAKAIKVTCFGFRYNLPISSAAEPQFS
jgi:hypothetical protein